MLFQDARGYLTAQSLDGGDSAVRAGLMAVFTGQPGKILDFVNDAGLCVRNPWQVPWNNPNNFTKDQLKCLVAGLVAIGRRDLCEKIYLAHVARNRFCQNSERDAVGSTKMKWPHAFYKDSIPDTTTAAMKWKWLKFRFEVDESKLDVSKTIETKIFDGPDYMLPNDMEFLRVAAYGNPEGLGLWWHHQAIKSHANSSHNEENQMFSECFVVGTLKEYFETNKQFDERSFKYWVTDRNEGEYHEFMTGFKTKILGGV